jgi:hypothetical protein
MLVQRDRDGELFEIVGRDRGFPFPPFVLAPFQDRGNADIDRVVFGARKVSGAIANNEARENQLALEQSKPLRDDLLGL